MRALPADANRPPRRAAETNAVGGVGNDSHSTSKSSEDVDVVGCVCGFCGGRGTIPLALSWACPPCWGRVLGDARARYIAETGGVGFMRQVGVMRPDHGPHFAECECSQCGYEAIVVVGDDCNACLAWWQRANARQDRGRVRDAA